MRSRYSAYVLANEAYLRQTWHVSTRPNESIIQAEPVKWLGLEVLKHEHASGNKAQVEFVARYKIQGRAHRMHEVSDFVRENGLWFYVSGDVN
ncbi:SEC-C motif-containing protein [Hydromonas duriensis]|uniref:SEC-C motif-containing protein n=2 Tax=Hydromonas duriensis TaxID=1527608 RepID=A0A4R6Y1A3_9BURK|nr:SEC-C motif-containing protein [Hydromonas duriensis]